MVDDPFSKYVQARVAFAMAEQELDRTVTRVRDITRRLTDNPRRFGFAGIKPALPPEVLAARRGQWGERPDIVAAHEWPTAEAIQQAVARWHQSRVALAAAYDAIPKAQRGAVVAPSFRG